MTFTAALLEGVGFYTLTIYAWPGRPRHTASACSAGPIRQIGKLARGHHSDRRARQHVPRSGWPTSGGSKGVSHANLRVGALCSRRHGDHQHRDGIRREPRPTMIFLALGAGVLLLACLGVGPLDHPGHRALRRCGDVLPSTPGTLNIIGAGFGPVAVGVLTDYVLRDASAIGTAAPDRAGSGCRSPSPPWISRPSAFDPRSIRS